MRSIPKIVITGGPCAAKTTILSYLQQVLPEHGIVPFTVPEQARVFKKGGLFPPLVDPVLFQTALMRSIMTIEDHFTELASSAQVDRAVVLCDRGAMDAKAYLTPHEFSRVLNHCGWPVARLRDARYSAVVHLVTAAEGAEEFYVTDGERLESPEEARRLDAATYAAWVGHSHLAYIDNTTDLEGKRHRALKYILHQLGVPVPLEIERKYHIDGSHRCDLPRHAQKIDIEQTYLASSEPGVQERVRARGQDGHMVYYRAKKRTISPGVRNEQEWQISEAEYTQALAHRLPGTATVKKTRSCFLYQSQYFELDDFSPMGKGFSDCCLLEVELTEEHQKVTLPPWLKIIEDVTGRKEYDNFEIACAAS